MTYKQGSKYSVARLPGASKLWVGQVELVHSLPDGQVDKIGYYLALYFLYNRGIQEMESFSDSVFQI